MNASNFLSKENMRKILLLCFAIILMIVGVFKISSILALLGEIIDVFLPFIIGAGIAFVFNVPMRKIENSLFAKKPNFKGKRAISYILSLLLILGIIALAAFFIIPELIDTIGSLIGKLPEFGKAAVAWFNGLSNAEEHPMISKIIERLDISTSDLSSKILSAITGTSSAMDTATGAIGTATSIISNIVSGLATFIIAFVFSIYILFRKEDLVRQSKKVMFAFLPEDKAKSLIDVFKLSNHVFSNFITGQCLEACILGSIFFVVLSIIGMPFEILISVLIAITALIPVFGAFIGCGIGAVLILIGDAESGGLHIKDVVIFIILFFIIQQIEGNLIYPHVVGNSVGLPSIWVLVAITVGGNLFGLVGMLVFIPLCSVAYALFRKYVNRRLKERNIPKTDYEAPVVHVRPKPKKGEVIDG